jgi:CO/xanthine dehydrogenase Mo-binding subunit
LPVNPMMVDAQMQSGTIFGLTAALRGAITIKDGRVEPGWPFRCSPCWSGLPSSRLRR